MKKFYAVLLSMLLFVSALIPAVETEAAGKSLVASEKAFFKEMKQFDYKGMKRYVKKWDKSVSDVEMMYALPNGRKYFKKCGSKMQIKILSTKVKGKKADVKVKFRYMNGEDFIINFYQVVLDYLIKGKLDLEHMSDQQILKTFNAMLGQSMKGVKYKKYRTQTLTIRFVKTKSCWKIEKASGKLINVMLANFETNMEKLEKAK